MMQMETLESRNAPSSVSMVGTIYLDYSAMPEPYEFDIRLPYDISTARGHSSSVNPLSVRDGSLHYQYFFGAIVSLDMEGFDETNYDYWHRGCRIVGSVYHAGDADRDGDVDFSDFLNLSSNFGQAQDAVWADSDFSLDGAVDFQDFLMLSANFGN